MFLVALHILYLFYLSLYIISISFSFLKFNQCRIINHWKYISVKQQWKLHINIVVKITFDYRTLSFCAKLLTITLLLNLYEDNSEKSIGQFWEKDILHELAWTTTTSFYCLCCIWHSILFDQNQFKDLGLGLDFKGLWEIKIQMKWWHFPMNSKGINWKLLNGHLNKKVLRHHSVACFNRIVVGILLWKVCPMGYPFMLAIFCWQTFWPDNGVPFRIRIAIQCSAKISDKISIVKLAATERRFVLIGGGHEAEEEVCKQVRKKYWMKGKEKYEDGSVAREE